MKLKKRTLASDVLIVVFSAALSYLFFFTVGVTADDGGALGHIEEYYATGVDIEGLVHWRSLLDFWFSVAFLAYRVFGVSLTAVRFHYSALAFLCFVPALYLCVYSGRETRKPNLWLLPLGVFIFMPRQIDSTFHATNLYHRSTICWLLLVFALLYALFDARCAPREMPKRRRTALLGCFAMAVVILSLMRDFMLSVLCLLLPAAMWAALALLQDEKLLRRAKKYLYGVLALIGVGLAYAGIRNVLSGTQQSAGLSVYGSYIAWSPLSELPNNIVTYFGDWAYCWNIAFEGSLLSLTSVFIVLRSLVLAAAFAAFLATLIRCFRRGVRQVHPADALCAFCILASMLMGFVSGSGFRYSGTAYYLYAVLLCRRISELAEKKSALFGGKDRAAAAGLLLLFSIGMLEPLEPYTQALRYAPAVEAPRFLLENGVTYGLGTFLTEGAGYVFSDGKLRLQGVAQNAGPELCLGEHNWQNVYYLDGCNPFYGCIIESSNPASALVACLDAGESLEGLPGEKYWYEGLSTVDIYRSWGMWEQAADFSDTAGDPYLSAFIYDYDLRWYPQPISSWLGEYDTIDSGEAVRLVLSPGDTMLSQLTLPLGEGRIELTGEGLARAECILRGNEEKCGWRIAEQTEQHIVLETSCSGVASVQLVLNAAGEGETALDSALFKVVYAAKDLLTSISLQPGEQKTVSAQIPAGVYKLVLYGENIGALTLTRTEDGALLPLEPRESGTKRACYVIDLERDAALSLQLCNASGETLVIDKFAYELEPETRQLIVTGIGNVG